MVWVIFFDYTKTYKNLSYLYIGGWRQKQRIHFDVVSGRRRMLPYVFLIDWPFFMMKLYSWMILRSVISPLIPKSMKTEGSI